MKFKKLLSSLTVVILLYPICILANTPLPTEVVNVLNRHKLPHSSMSLYIKELNSSDPIVSYKIDEARNPASVMKLVTTLSALDMLGLNYQWKTNFYSLGTLKNGTLKGNLYIKGGGDPFFVREDLWHAIHSIQTRGIKHIDGDLIIDNSLYAQEQGKPGDFDKRPHRAYNAFPDAALLNFNAQEFVLLPKNNRLHIFTDPPATNLNIKNNVKLTNGKCRGISALGMNVSNNNHKTETTIEFSGNYSKRCNGHTLLRSVSQNTEFTFGVFKALWQNMLGNITGSVKNNLVPADARLIHSSPSKPLREIIQYINKASNNVMARQLMLTIGKEIHGKPGTKQTASLAIKDWLRRVGIGGDELVIENGAGLSRKARINALTLGRLLEFAHRSHYSPEYLSSLPIAGIDGTMRKRLKGEVPPGSMRIKTGLLNNVRSMAGYVTAKSGKEYIVVSLQNHKGVQNWTGTEVQNALLKWLYNKH